MKCPSYKAAIRWVSNNDDTYWLDAAHPILSVCAAMICDLYGKPEAVVLKDLQRATGREPK